MVRCEALNISGEFFRAKRTYIPDSSLSEAHEHTRRRAWGQMGGRGLVRDMLVRRRHDDGQKPDTDDGVQSSTMPTFAR